MGFATIQTLLNAAEAGLVRSRLEAAGFHPPIECPRPRDVQIPVKSLFSESASIAIVPRHMKRLFPASAIFALVSFVFALSTIAAQNWPQFRGPAGDGHSTSKNLPLKWSETENVTWKVPIHDRGWSSLITTNTARRWGDKSVSAGIA